jgi:ABC-2 type transport system permease protein
MTTWANIGRIARREYVIRVRTRSFVLGTLLLVAGVVVIAWLPVIVQKIDQGDATRVAVVAPTGEEASRAAATLGALLNATTNADPRAATEQPDYIVTAVADLAEARTAVGAGTYGFALSLERSPDGELGFTLYTKEPATSRNTSVIRQAASAIAIADRLGRLGVAPPDQASLFAPAELQVAWADPAKTEPLKDTMATVGQDMLSFGMTILIFMIIVMYGNWIAMSVVEEKTSRVMEVVLNAATPVQLLAGKVFGVGAVALTQYAAVVAVGMVALLAQQPLASLVLGGGGTSIALPEGLSPGLLLLFGVYGVLGFLLYASLFAAAGSLVSRQEDVNSVVMPMTLLATAGYMVGVYAALGLLDIGAWWIVVMTQVPFLSPFMMLGRAAAAVAQPWEIVLSITLLVAAIAAAIWIAARIYAVGVLLYGQRPGPRATWRLLREGM